MLIQKQGRGETWMQRCMQISWRKSMRTKRGYVIFSIIRPSTTISTQPRTFTFCFISTAAYFTYRETVYKVAIWIVFELSAKPLPYVSTILPGTKSTLKAISLSDVASKNYTKKTDSLYFVALQLLAFMGPFDVLIIINVLKSYSSSVVYPYPTWRQSSEDPTERETALFTFL